MQYFAITCQAVNQTCAQSKLHQSGHLWATCKWLTTFLIFYLCVCFVDLCELLISFCTFQLLCGDSVSSSIAIEFRPLQNPHDYFVGAPRGPELKFQRQPLKYTSHRLFCCPPGMCLYLPLNLSFRHRTLSAVNVLRRLAYFA